jgi:acetyl-CoA synthetase
VAWLLAARPDGVRADHVAETLGKSVSTAYNLLASLCEEGVATHEAGGLYRLAPAFRDTVATGAAVSSAPELHDLAGLVADLLARTHKRSYLAIVRAGVLHIVLERGLQGMPKLPGLKVRIGDTAHALAMGKVVLALAGPEVLERYVRHPGLRRFTPHTITDPEALRAELAETRRRGYAVEREEFDADFCCIAAPVRDPRGRFLAVVGISMSRRAFDDERENLAATVLDVAGIANGTPPKVAPLRASGTAKTDGFQAYAETKSVLDPPGSPRLASHYGTTRAVSAACANTPVSATAAAARSERRCRP